MPDDRKKGRLSHVELAALDLTITALQAAGQVIDGGKDDDPRQQMVEATLDLHGLPLTQQDREIVKQIKGLASQLSSRTTLAELLKMRAKAVQER